MPSIDTPAPRFAEQLSVVIGLIYETAVDESLWPQLLEAMAGLIVAPQDAALAIPDTGLGMARTLDLASTLSLATSDAQQYLLACLAPHFARSQRMQQELQDVEIERDLLERVMDRLPLGMAIVDGHGRAISMNRAMLSLAQAGSGLRLQAGHLASEPADALGTAITRVLSRQQDHACVRLEPRHATAPLPESAANETQTRAEAPKGLSLWVSRFGQAAGEGRAMVLAASPGSRALSEDGLCAFFALSPAEARLTQQLALGHSIEDAAKALGVSHNTAKTQLKKVFFKVGVKRQPELLQAIYASPLWLDMGPQSRRMQPRRATLQAALEGVDALPTGQGMRLPDGRWMAWSDNGDPKGWPLVLCHGLLHGQHDRHPDDSILHQLGVRLLIPERPGCGDSDAAAHVGIEQWPQDLACMLEHLGIKGFGLMSWSLGAPYAVAVANHFGARAQVLVLVSPMTPVLDVSELRFYSGLVRMILLTALFTPRLLTLMMRTMVRGVQRDVYGFLESLFPRAPPSEKRIFESPMYRQRRAAVLLKAARRGATLVADECLKAVHGWKVQSPSAQVPCKIWHGDADPEVHWHGARSLAQKLGGVELKIVPRAGHYLMMTHWQTILQELVVLRSRTADESVEALT